MADALGEHALAAHALCLAHIVSAGFEFGNELLHFHLLHASCGVGCHHLAELLEAELHIVEVLDGLSELYGNICEHGLEASEGFAGSAA